MAFTGGCDGGGVGGLVKGKASGTVHATPQAISEEHTHPPIRLCLSDTIESRRGGFARKSQGYTLPLQGGATWAKHYKHLGWGSGRREKNLLKNAAKKKALFHILPPGASRRRGETESVG